MKLLDKPFNHNEKRNIRDMLDGCINRICVSDNHLEIVRMIGFAIEYVAMLGQSRMIQLDEKRNADDSQNLPF